MHYACPIRPHRPTRTRDAGDDHGAKEQADLVAQCGVPNPPIAVPLIDGPVEQLQVFGNAAQGEAMRPGTSV